MSTPRPSRMPGFARRLWLRLSLVFTALCVAAMVLMMLSTVTLFNRQSYRATFTEANIESVVRGSLASPPPFADVRSSTGAAGAITVEGAQERWLESLHGRLLGLQKPSVNTDLFRLDQVSRPRVQLELRDLGGGVIASYPGPTPPEGGAASVRRVESRIDDAGGRRLGSVTVHYAAPYDLFLSLATNLRWIGAMWQVTLINALLIGTGCGVAAAAYVVSRLRSIDAVTSRWRRGDFAARIDLPSGDELAEHSVRLNAMAEELQSLFQLRQAVAVTEERQRVARELHDTVKQKLFALALQLAVVRSKAGDLPAAAAPIAESESLIHEAQRDLKEILTQLRPLDDVESPFSERLRSVLDDFVRRFAVSIHFEHDGAVQPRPTSEHHLVRIAQEAVTNAIRHGACDNVEISVTLDGERAALGIRDDGVGFEVARVTPGLGIRSIRERAAELPGGEATITSEPGGGAAVQVFWRHDGGSQQRH